MLTFSIIQFNGEAGNAVTAKVAKIKSKNHHIKDQK